MKISQKDLLKISCKTNGRCFYCNDFGEVVDHFMPKKIVLENTPWLGSGDELENLFLACSDCNQRKGAQSPEDFTKKGFLVWGRYIRTNRRIGLCFDMTPNELMYGKN